MSHNHKDSNHLKADIETSILILAKTSNLDYPDKILLAEKYRRLTSISKGVKARI